jgi:hypothetical protein
VAQQVIQVVLEALEAAQVAVEDHQQLEDLQLKALVAEELVMEMQEVQLQHLHHIAVAQVEVQEELDKMVEQEQLLTVELDYKILYLAQHYFTLAVAAVVAEEIT